MLKSNCLYAIFIRVKKKIHNHFFLRIFTLQNHILTPYYKGLNTSVIYDFRIHFLGKLISLLRMVFTENQIILFLQHISFEIFWRIRQNDVIHE